VLKGIAEFALAPPVITNRENYKRQIASGGNLFPTTINIFNISKINSEVRGGRSPKIRSFREEIGESYFDYLAGLHDLVLIMDELHRYRASAGIRAINELKPVIGLELTAMPFVETPRGPVAFRNVIFDYPLGKAMEDGFVKELAVITRENFVVAGKSPETIQQIKLEDGVRLHESVKVELETYARQADERIVKPFMLVIARDLERPDVQAALLREVESQYRTTQLELDGITAQPDLASIIARTTALVVQQTIDIPRILVVPKGEVKRKVLWLYQKEIAGFVYAQMQAHFWQDTQLGYEVVITRGFSELRNSAYTAAADEAPLDFRLSPSDKSNMSRYVFGGFSRCLYPTQKFQSDAERKLAIVLKRESLKWFKPAKGQFQLFYRNGVDDLEYQPDFVAETETRIFMLEPKASNQMAAQDVIAKQDVAVEWCRRATKHAAGYQGKPWSYVLIPHNAITENMTLTGLARQYAVQ
jgi:hypothetical protein